MSNDELLRPYLYKLFKDPKVDDSYKEPLMDGIAYRIGKLDGSLKKQMDPFIMENISGPHGLASVTYADSYKVAREKVGGKTTKRYNKFRKTRRVRKVNGRK